MTPSGSSANANGNQLEQLVLSLIGQSSYQKCRAQEFLKLCSSSTDKLYASQVTLGETIYPGKHRRCDIALFHPLWKQKHPHGILVIECKWQQRSGSVDEKYPYLVHNIKHLAYHTLILLDGGGYSKGSEIWLRKQVGGNLLGVYNMTELLTAVNGGLFN